MEPLSEELGVRVVVELGLCVHDGLEDCETLGVGLELGVVD